MAGCGQNVSGGVLGTTFVSHHNCPDKVSILVSVGTQFSFDRMTAMVDRWLEMNQSMSNRVLMQVGPGGLLPRNAYGVESLTPDQYHKAASTCDLLVCHAGIGSILTAAEMELPIVIVPRRYELGEHRNDHQLSTAREFSQRKGIYVAETEAALHQLMDDRVKLDRTQPTQLDPGFANHLDAFIRGPE